MDIQMTPLNLAETSNISTETQHNDEMRIAKWRSKAIRGKYPNILGDRNVDSNASNSRLSVGDLFKETEGFVIAIRDGVIATKNYRNNILNDDTIRVTNVDCAITIQRR